MFVDEIISSKKWISQVNSGIPGRWFPLHFAAANHQFKVCSWLLENGAWPDVVTVSGDTPLLLVRIHTPMLGSLSDQRLLRSIRHLLRLSLSRTVRA